MRFGSISEKSGSVPFAASILNCSNGTTWVAKRSRSRGQWMTAVKDAGQGSRT
jgi:hypothetical protein